MRIRRFRLAMIAAAAGVLALVGCRGQGDLAEVAAKAGEWEEAVGIYREYLREHPHDIIGLETASSILAYELGRYDEAAAYADTLVKIYPVDTLGVAVSVYAHTMLAQQAAARNDTATVVRELDKIAETYMTSAYWQYINMNFARAGWQYRQVTRLQPERVEAYLRVAQVYYHRHMPDSAVAWYRRAIELDPDNEDAHANIVVVQYESQGVQAAQGALADLRALRSRLYPDSSFVDSNRYRVPPLTIDYRILPPER